jgi:NAD(P)-dependent dehydrogenase (short-subunit alcohol dehydrogenase family)
MLEGKVAIITGGTRGIGFAIAKKYLENNAKVIIFGSRSETVEKAIEELKSLNDKYEVEGYYPNLTDE